MVTRRQFGLWTTAALVVGPGVAVAGGSKSKEAQAITQFESTKPGDLTAVELKVAVRELTDEGGLVLEVTATNTSKKGQTLMLDVAHASAGNGDVSKELLAWMNDQNPYSRRFQMPSFVDLPSKQPVMAGIVNTQVDPKLAAAPGAMLRLTLRVHDGHGKKRELEIPPIALNALDQRELLIVDKTPDELWLDELLADRILDRIDVIGRPLGEQASRRIGEVESVLKTCPFHDSRRGGQMNTTAFRQVEAHWPEVLAGLRATTGPTAGDAWRACCRLRWASLGLPDPVSQVVAARFKTALGLGRPLSSWLLLSPGAAGAPLEELMPADQLMTRLEDEGWLHGAHQVCAGPAVRIVEAWRALSEPGGGGGALAPELVSADRAMDLVVGLWAILGATRQVILEGGLDPSWGFGVMAEPDPAWPEVLRLLQLNGPGALVREVPRFEPEWALHVYASPPPDVGRAVERARAAVTAPDPFGALDQAWAALRGQRGQSPKSHS